jgi:peroxiredoxin
MTDFLFKRPLFLGLVLLLGVAACSSESRKHKTKATQTEPQLDPLSSPLYPFKKEAPAPDFTTTLVNGNSFQLSQQKGKVVVINIWATWCAPCLEETPDLVELYNTYRDQGLVILGVSIDKQGKAVVEPFMDKFEVTYPIVIDDGTVLEKYQTAMGIPNTYVIDKTGHMRYYAVGALTKRELEPRLKKLLDE